MGTPFNVVARAYQVFAVADRFLVVGNGDVPAAGLPEAAQVFGGTGGIGMSTGGSAGVGVGWHPRIRDVRGDDVLRGTGRGGARAVVVNGGDIAPTCRP